jgi:hypothetical protein
MAVATVACTINMIMIVINDDSGGANYDCSSVTRETPHLELHSRGIFEEPRGFINDCNILICL